MPNTKPRFAIINGDDFGFSAGVNQAIIQAHEQGVLTSTSLMVTGDAAADAIAWARDRPSLAVGLHLVLVCGRSVLPPSQIPHLVDSQGNFSDSPLVAGLRYQFYPAAREELRQEIRAQLEKFRQSGLPLSHVDGHLHLHVHPVILRILVELAPEFNIQVIRLPSEELQMSLKLDRSALLTKLVWSGVFGRLRSYGESLLTAHGIKFAQRVYGLLQTGNMSEQYLLGLIPQIQAELVEIYSHPALVQPGEPLNGLPGAGEIELAALLSEQVRQVLTINGFELTNYHQLE
ncbi:hopanoid biosynthesis-associated protein HpnK [Calothrix sp. FACHB-1219]|uniref:hopanoid biosynthesis-associated protein HpnK n=1 Tax=unclassified Calothrix TaxID=2619626 RepID=UPI001684C867|nr:MULTISPECIES: hopanoid biosynthesis-associated protein HpnK [unclassified Calothrix]MBD2202058.1 hopanoid biosynthesis-associated protein HpnK [Calothrix sp. FACHB-168]MBD2217093.1 hopanoid biosynthesis-associated protein HpnK [Calothrix sp. FACHB-1219]